MKKILLAATAIGLMFASCKKTEQSVKSTNPALAHHSTSEGGCDPSNPANPVDVTGVWHNNACDFALAYASATGDNSIAGLAGQVNKYAGSTGVAGDPDLAAHMNTVLGDEGDRYATIIAGGTTDPVIKRYATELMNDIYDASFPDPSSISYCDYKNVIMSFEARVAADPSLTAAESNTIYAMSSVARYSGYNWWNGTIGSSKLPGGDHVPVDGPTYASYKHILAADCIGGFLGGGAGFAGASLAAWYYGW